jgi:pimeloyl-ACP methyl ester carboxylesterase
VSPDFAFESFRSFDGTEIALQRRGGGGGTPVILTNGLGGDYRAWQHVFDHFAHERPIATWDYRGLYRSGPPQTRGSLSPPFQCLDLQGLLDHLGWSRVVLVGWSMGVQVNFEAWRRFPERIAGVAAINGVAGRPFDSVLGSRVVRYVIPAILKQLHRRHRLVSRLSLAATGWQGLLPLMQRFGMVSASVDLAFFAEFARSFAALDFDVYLATLRALGKHDAHDVLPSLTVPLRIITGDRDVMTPVATARVMKQAVQGATLRVLHGATHYTPVEYPDAVVGELAELFRDVDRREVAKAAG